MVNIIIWWYWCEYYAQHFHATKNWEGQDEMSSIQYGWHMVDIVCMYTEWMTSGPYGPCHPYSMGTYSRDGIWLTHTMDDIFSIFGSMLLVILVWCYKKILAVTARIDLFLSDGEHVTTDEWLYIYQWWTANLTVTKCQLDCMWCGTRKSFD